MTFWCSFRLQSRYIFLPVCHWFKNISSEKIYMFLNLKVYHWFSPISVNLISNISQFSHDTDFHKLFPVFYGSQLFSSDKLDNSTLFEPQFLMGQHFNLYWAITIVSFSSYPSSHGKVQAHRCNHQSFTDFCCSKHASIPEIDWWCY